MFSEAKVTEIYCLADDFCKEFAKYQENQIFPNSPMNGKHCNNLIRMCEAATQTFLHERLANSP